jgi:hypothetical protein
MASWSQYLEPLRRSNDIAVDLSENGEWCQFDVTTGWPKYTMQEASGPMLESACRIDETSDRGITPRQLLAVYEHVKRHCVTEEWTGWDGKSLAPGTVTLYDLCKYVIKPATEAHECSFVELVTRGGEASVRRCPDGHVPMARTKVYDGIPKAEEIACTQCVTKIDLDATYWVCHRCGDKHKLCGACTPAPAPVACAELQRPLWFVSHWYGRTRSCVPRFGATSAPAAGEQVGGARRQLHRVPPAARARPVLRCCRRRLVARHPVLGVRVREQPVGVRAHPPGGRSSKRVFAEQHLRSGWTAT